EPPYLLTLDMAEGRARTVLTLANRFHYALRPQARRRPVAWRTARSAEAIDVLTKRPAAATAAEASAPTAATCQAASCHTSEQPRQAGALALPSASIGTARTRRKCSPIERSVAATLSTSAAIREPNSRAMFMTTQRIRRTRATTL